MAQAGLSLSQCGGGKPGGGKGPLIKDELSLSLSTQNTQTVFEKVNIYDLTHHDEVVRQVHGNKTQTLKARMGTGGNNTPIVQCVGNGQLHQVYLSEAMQGGGSETLIIGK